MPIRFFVKPSRPSTKEKQLFNEITKIIEDAERAGDGEIIKIVKNKGVVTNYEGLNGLMNELNRARSNKSEAIQEPVTNQAPKQTQKQEVMGDNINQNPSGQEDEVKFEETLDLETESQIQQPVIEREDEIAKYRQQMGFDNDGRGDGGGDNGGGYGGGGGHDDSGGEYQEDYTESRDTGDNGGGGDSGDDGGGGGNLKDIPPATKRKAINKTAEIVSGIYAKVLPMIPKWIARVPESKIERMSWADEIDLKMELDLEEQGTTTVGEYIHEYNDQLEQALIITEEQRQEFQECLKDVLEEKNVAMTPTQRLVSVVVAQTFTLFAIGIQNTIIMNRNLKHWKDVHEERKRERDRGKEPPSDRGGNKTAPPPPPPPPASSNGSQKKEGKVEDIQTESEEISIEPEKVQE